MAALTTLILVILSVLSCRADPSKLLIASAMENANVSKLFYLCDTFGPRYPGTENYHNALDWILQTMNEEGLQNVHSEPVKNITNWIRGKESLVMTKPRLHTMAILGLGHSVGTGPDGIKAQTLVVTSFDDLNNKSAQASGKIVVFNAPFTSYGETVMYRVLGATAASKYGAVAALVRSVTPFSLYTPHTGSTEYEDKVKRIPIAAITIEDAEMLGRFQARGQQVELTLQMDAQTGPDVTERNILAEVVGSQIPQEIVLIGGHSDSWDVGQGAMDDGGGLFSTWEAVRIISSAVKSGLVPRPKRTIRVILWTNEELGARGAEAYKEAHAAELKLHVAAIESDTGNFKPTGFGYSPVNVTERSPIKQAITNASNYLAAFGAGNVTINDGEDTDNGFLYPEVTCLTLESEGFEPINGDVKNAYYFFYHHSNADSVTSLDVTGLRQSVAAFAVMTYNLANI